jgi:hypothetical protein
MRGIDWYIGKYWTSSGGVVARRKSDELTG